MTRNQCKVKICGTARLTDAKMVVEAGADYSGIVVEVPFSERSVSIGRAAEFVRATSIRSVVLTFDRTVDWVERAVAEIQPFAIQLLGHETPTTVECLKRALSCEIWKSLFLPVSGAGASAHIDAIHDEMEAYINAGADALLFDTVELSSGKTRFGGTGKTSDWDLAAELIATCNKVPAFLSGGIRPENVKQAIETVRPYGIDLCSGVESAKGVRDAGKLKRLMEQVQDKAGRLQGWKTGGMEE
jgi:phosphoribosylanthranilate isomerase